MNIKKYTELFKRHKAVILYLFFGGLTTVINIGLYSLCFYTLGLGNDSSNIISWFITVTVAYITNKIWVFESRKSDLKTLMYEVFTFFSCRIATGVIDFIIMHWCVDVWNFNAFIFKVLSNVIVIILNYIASKTVIFKGSR